MKTIHVAITGGIGTGKTTVCNLFEVFEVPIYNSDLRARWIMNNHPVLRKELVEVFGESVYTQDGTLDRGYLGNIVFKDKDKLDRLNSIVHPRMFQDTIEWQAAQKEVPYTLRETALLFETGHHKSVDKVIVVTAPLQVRIDRVMRRDNIDEQAVKDRISKQWPEEKKIELADFVINNDGKSSLLKQVWDLHQHLKHLSKQ